MSCLEFWTDLQKYFALWHGLVFMCGLICPCDLLLSQHNCKIIVVTMRRQKTKTKVFIRPRFKEGFQVFSLFVKDQESKHLPNLGHQYCVNLFCLSWKSFCGFCNNKSSFGGAVVTYNDEEAFCILLYSGHFSSSQAQTSISSPILSQRDTPPVPGRRKTQKRRNKT